MRNDRLLRSGCLSLALAFFTSLAAASAADNFEQKFEAEVRPLLERYCYACHSSTKKEGELDLAALDNGKKAVQATYWPAVIQRFSEKEMPPQGSPSPSDAERSQLFQWMQGLLVHDDGNCNKLATDVTQHFYRGNVMSRRLTRSEYNNTIRDLVGLDFKPADVFPAEGSGGEGFDTNGDALFTNPILLEKYFAAADRIIETVLPDETSQLSPEQLAAREQILIAVPEQSTSPRDAAAKILKAFATRAYRRPATTEEIDQLLALFDKSQTRKDHFLGSLRLALKGILTSPNFLFLVEPEPANEGVYSLGMYPLASRLSYFLWATMPDEQLLALAEDQSLAQPEVLRAQVRRMLADPRVHGMAESFALQWLELAALGEETQLDGGKYPDFNQDLVRSMKGEAIALVETIFREDRSLLEFLASDYVLVDQKLAGHYGIPDIQGNHFRRVSTSDSNRGGLLGLAAMHAATSYPLRSSPVLRGKWVLSVVLGGKVPPPPPDVPNFTPDDATIDGLTLRQRFEQHRKDPKCASCHNRLDPLGFGLENFDAVGRWRKEIGGQPIDATGELPGGEKFSSSAELKQVLLARKKEFLQHLSKKMLGFALGRGLNRFDECVIRDANRALEKLDYRSHVLFEEIVVSFPFRHRFAKK